MMSLVSLLIVGGVLGGILGWLLGRGRRAPLRADRAPPAPAPPAVAPAGPAPLHDPAQVLWSLVCQGRLLVVRPDILDGHSVMQTYLALQIAACEHWHADGTRSVCELGLEQLQLRWPRTLARDAGGQPGISEKWLQLSAKALQERGRLELVGVPKGPLNRRGIGFRTILLPGEGKNGQQCELFAAPPPPQPEDLGPATEAGGRGIWGSNSGIWGSRDPGHFRAGSGDPASGSRDPAPPQTPPVSLRSVSSEKDLLTPTSPPRDPPTAAPAPGPAFAAIPPTPTANTAPPPSPGPKGGGSVVALRPKGTCFQCLSGYSLPESPAEKTEPRRVPAMGLVGVLPETLRAVPITSELFEEYCGACLVRAAERLRAAYPLDRPEGWTTRGGVLLKSPAAGLKRILENERHGRPWRTEVRAAASGERPPPPIAPREEQDDPWRTSLPLRVPEPAAAQLWDRVLRQLAGVLEAGEIGLWLRPLRLLAVEGGTLWADAPSRFLAETFAQRHEEQVLAQIASELGQPAVVLRWARAEEPPAESAAAAGGGP